MWSVFARVLKRLLEEGLILSVWYYVDFLWRLVRQELQSTNLLLPIDHLPIWLKALWAAIKAMLRTSPLGG